MSEFTITGYDRRHEIFMGCAQGRITWSTPFFVSPSAASPYPLSPSSATRPKSFAGLFGAAPSIALATLAIAVAQRGAGYAAIEARSMMLGAVALWLYSAGVCRLLEKHRVAALPASGAMIAGWLICAFGLKFLFLGLS